MELPTRILVHAEALFKLRGIRSVTMDDLAKDLRISKKTLYQYFANKADLVLGVSKAHFERERNTTEALISKALDPIHGILLVLECSSKSLKEIPTHMVYDIQKLYPKSWQMFHDFKEGYLLEVVRKNLEEGVAQGLYRKDMDIELVALIRLVQIESSMNEHYFPASRFEFVKVQMEQFSLFLHGIVTLKGKKLIYNYLNQPEDE